MTDSTDETSIAPWLAVRDGDAAVDYDREALGAVLVYRLDGDDGRAVVARLKVAAAEFWLQEDPESSPKASGGGSIRMILTVDDPDAMFERILAAGATLVAPVAEAHGWRTSCVTDPFGYDWEFVRPLATSD
jgi:PhnB protein